MQLNLAGYFSWPEWAGELSAVLHEATALNPKDDGSHYYDHWSTALERLCPAKGLTNTPALNSRTVAWADACRRTPHGRPVELPGD